MKRTRSLRPRVDEIESRLLLSSLAGAIRPGSLAPATIARRGGPPDTAIATPENPKVPLVNILSWHQGILERVANDGKPNVAFLGDSITGGWISTGQSTWDRLFAPLGAVDYALPGNMTQNLLWQLKNGVLAGQPRVTVVQIGINNLGLGDSPQETAQGVQAILREINRQAPTTRILVLGIFPPANDPAFSALVDQTNALIEVYARQARARFADLGSALRGLDGQPDRELFEGQVHLTPAGYEAVGSWLFGPVTQEVASAITPPAPSRPSRPAWPSPIAPPRPSWGGSQLPPPRWLIPAGMGRFR